MRRAYNGTEWIDKDGAFGIALGSDFCSEHEWGVQKLKDACGLDPKKDGIERRRITIVPPLFYRQYDGDIDVLAGFYSAHRLETFDPTVNSELRSFGVYGKTKEDKEKSRKQNELICAWNEGSFAIRVEGKEGREKLARLHQAFLDKDIAFWTNIGPFHIGGGLIFAQVSSIPKTDLEGMLASDLDHKKLVKAAEKIGIEERLRAAGKRWFALSPRWTKDSHKEAKTKYEVMFFLNPADQQTHKGYGWMTVEDLEDWIEGKGRVYGE